MMALMMVLLISILKTSLSIDALVSAAQFAVDYNEVGDDSNDNGGHNDKHSS